jgi:hypothetical protein
MIMPQEFSNDYYAYLLRVNSADLHPITQEYIDLLIRCKQLNIIDQGGVDSGMTALHRAVLIGNVKKVQWLLSAGADPMNPCHPPRNQTAIDFAYSIHDAYTKETVLKLLQSIPAPLKEMLSPA